MATENFTTKPITLVVEARLDIGRHVDAKETSWGRYCRL
jgi:hypothetical protein